MVATPTAPFVLFIESDAVDNDDWIADHAGDPDLITYTNFTEGTEILIFNKILRRSISALPGNVADPRPGGNTFEHRTGKRRYAYDYTFLVNSRAAVNLITKFPMLERHTEVTAPFKPFYLVDTQATNDHLTFVDNANAVKSYCRVHILQAVEVWTDQMSNKHAIKMTGVSSW